MKRIPSVPESSSASITLEVKAFIPKLWLWAAAEAWAIHAPALLSARRHDPQQQSFKTLPSLDHNRSGHRILCQ
jgi:hypothetical protein